MRIRSCLTALLVAAFAIFGSAGSAGAAGELGLSPDGVHWAAALPAPLFDPAFRWVPGDSETATFYVRNQAKNAGTLDVTMLAPQVHDLIDSGDLVVSARLDNGPWTSVSTAAAHTMISSAAVPPNGVRKITVRVDFEPASTNQTQDKQLDLRFQVTLSENGAVVSPPHTGTGHGGTTGHGSSGLPGTGTDVSPLMLLIAGLLCAGGAALATVGRRPSESSKERQNSHA